MFVASIPQRSLSTVLQCSVMGSSDYVEVNESTYAVMLPSL